MKSPSSQRTIDVASPCVVTVVTSPARPANTNGSARPDVATRNREVADLYKTYSGRFVASATAFVKSKAEADDIVQEAFTVLLASPGRTASRGTLWAITRQLCRDRMAAHANTDRYLGDDPEDENEVHECREWMGRLFE